MRPRRHSRPGTLLALALAAILVALAAGPSAYATLAPAGAVQRAWELARERGAFSWRSEATVTNTPLPVLENVGLSSKTQQLYAAGSLDLAAETLDLRIGALEGNLLNGVGGIELRLEGGVTRARADGRDWQELPGGGDLFAPGMDPLGYLAAARDVRLVRTGADETEYAFTLDGPAFAQHLREQLERSLREQGKLPAGVTLETAGAYRATTGSGTLVVGADGLPRRQQISATLPLAPASETAAIQVTHTFSDFRAPAPGLPAPRPRDLQRLGVNLALLAAGVLAAGLLIRGARSRRLYRALAVGVTASLLLTPLLESRRVAVAAESVQAINAESALAAAARDELAAPPAATFNPSAPAQTAPGGGTTAGTASDPQLDNGVDSDSDGLADGREQLLGTSPAARDTDSDGLADGVEVLELGTLPLQADSDADGLADVQEVNGFSLGGRRWYLDPLAADTNRDGLPDGIECMNDQGARDAQGRIALPCTDTDRDGLADVFDDDNDADGVPDRLDGAPVTSFTPPTANAQDPNSFNLTLNGYTANKPLFVSFTLRPAEASHLFYAGNVLDWPANDREGQQRRVFDTTFGTSGKDANGDMRLIPMLEIAIPAREGGFANLPTRPNPTMPALTSVPTSSVQLEAWYNQWLDRDRLQQLGITVRPRKADGSMLAYVPLNTVRDPITGDPVAFSGKMLYQPARGDFGPAHQVRLVWLIQGLQDSCTAVPAAFEPGKPEQERQAAWCKDAAHWVTNDQPAVLHSYYDRFSLADLSVREELGVSVAAVLQRAELTASPGGTLPFPQHVFNLARGLDQTFVAGRVGPDGKSRDLTVSSIKGRFDTSQSCGDPTRRWKIPCEALLVRTQEFTTSADVALLPAFYLPNWLTEAYGGEETGRPVTMPEPTVLLAREERGRQVGLSSGPSVTTRGADLTISFDPRQQATVLAGMSLSSYRYNSATKLWEDYPRDEAWAAREASFRALLGQHGPWSGADDASKSMVAGAAVFARGQIYSFEQGATNLVEESGVPTRLRDGTSAAQQPADSGLAFAPSAPQALADGAEALAARVLDAQRQKNLTGATLPADLLRAMGARQLWGQQSEALGLLGGAGDLLGADGARNRGHGLTAPAAASVALQLSIVPAAPPSTLDRAKEIGTAVGMAGLGLKSYAGAIDTFEETNKLVAQGMTRYKSLVEVSKQGFLGGKIGLTAGRMTTLVTVVKLGAATYQLYQKYQQEFGAGNPFAYKQMGGQIASTVAVTVALAALSLMVPIGSIGVAVLGAVDAVIGLVCSAAGLKGSLCAGITALVISELGKLFYDAKPYPQLDAKDLMALANWRVTPRDQQGPKGMFQEGDRLSIEFDVTTTLYANPSLPKTIAVAQPGMPLVESSYDPFDRIQQSNFDYRIVLSQKDGKEHLSVGDGNRAAWRYDPAQRRAVRVQQVLDDSLVLQPGINWKPQGVFLVQNYAVPALECTVGSCSDGEQPIRRSTPMTLTELIKFDVFPSTLDRFYTLEDRAGGGGSFALAWDKGFPVLKDADGDGLRSVAAGGNDPADNSTDGDGDGLSDFYEVGNASRGFDPKQADGDGDGLADAAELRFGTAPGKADSDGDGLKDGDEVAHLNRDGSWSGGWAIVYGYDGAGAPLTGLVSADPLKADSDDDGILDKEEYTYGFNPRAFNKLDVLKVLTRIDERDGARDGIVAAGAAIPYTATVDNATRNRYAFGLLESTLPGGVASGDLKPQPYTLAPGGSVSMAGTLDLRGITSSQKVAIVNRAGAIIADPQKLTDGRSLWLHFDEPAGQRRFLDSSLLGNDATCAQGACPTAGADGYLGRAVQFEPGRTLQVGYSPRLNGKARTVSFWVRPAAQAASKWTILAQGGLTIALLPGGNRLGVSQRYSERICLWGNWGCSFATGTATLDSNGAIAPQSWTHVAVVQDGKQIAIYLNGRLDTRTDSTAALGQGADPLVVGGGLSGDLDELSVYDRALDGREVAALVNSPALWLTFEQRPSPRDSSPFASPLTVRGPGALRTASDRNGSQVARFEQKAWAEAGPGQALNFGGSGGFSFSFWIQPSFAPNNRDEDWLGVIGYETIKDRKPASYAPGVYINRQGTQLRAVYSVAGRETQPCTATTGAILKPGAWQHVAVSYDQAQVVFYVDGAERARVPVEGPCQRAPLASDRLWVGRASPLVRVSFPKLVVSRRNEVGTNRYYIKWRNQRVAEGSEFFSAEDTRRWVNLSAPRQVELLDSSVQIGDPSDLSALERAGNFFQLWEDDSGESTRGDDDLLLSFALPLSQPTAEGRQRYNAGGDGQGEVEYRVEHLAFLGGLDEVRAFRRALTAQEVRDTYLDTTQVLQLGLDEAPGASQFRDSSGNGASGLCAAGACPGSGEAGRVGQAARFNGSSEVRVVSAPRPGSDAGLSVSAWVRLDDPGGDQKIVSRLDESGGKRTGYVLGVKEGRLFVELWDAQGNYAFVRGSTPIAANSWTHLAFTASPSDALIGYVNGRADGQASLLLGRHEVAGRPASEMGVTLFRNRDFGPPGLFVTGDLGYVGKDWNDKVRSAQFQNACATFFADANYQGSNSFKCDGESVRPDLIDGTSSVRVYNRPPTAAGDGVAFNERSGYLTVAQSEATSARLDTASVSAWVSLDHLPTGFERIGILSRVSFGFFAGSGGPELSFRGKMSGELPQIRPGQWHHLAAVDDGARVTFYVDGVAIPARPITNEYREDPAKPFMIGFAELVGNGRFQGKLRQLALYGRALDGAEVTALKDDPVKASAVARLFYLPFDEPAGATRFGMPVVAGLPSAGKDIVIGRAPWGAEFGVRGVIDEVSVVQGVLPPAAVAAQLAQAPALSLSLDEGLGATSFANSAGAPAACSGAGCPAAGAKGRIRGALVFDGQDDRLTVPDGAAVDVDRHTLSLWVRPTAIKGGQDQTLVSKGREGGPYNYRLRIEAGSLRLIYAVACPDRNHSLTSLRSLNQDQWNHVAAVFDGGQLQLYINGTLDRSGTLSCAGLLANDSPLVLGQHFNGWDAFAGLLDEVQLYQVALDKARVGRVYEYQSAWFDTASTASISVDADRPEVRLDLAPTARLPLNRTTILPVFARDGGSPLASVEYDLGGGWQSAGKDNEFWSLAFTPTTAGSATLRLRATDSVGNTTEQTVAVLTGDQALPPQVQIDDLALRGTLGVRRGPGGAGWVLPIGGTASNAAQVVARVLSRAGVVVGAPLTLTPSDGAWRGEYTFPSPPDGRFTLEVAAAGDGQATARATAELTLDGLAPVAELGLAREELGGAGAGRTLRGVALDTMALPAPALALRFDGDFACGSGQSCPTVQAGRVGQGAAFGSAGGAVVQPMGLSAAPVTVAAWIKPADSAGQRRGVLLVEPARSDAQPGLQLRLENNTLYAGLAIGGQLRELAAPGIAPGQWQHVALSYDGATARLYLDGAQVAAVEAAGALALGPQLWVGKDSRDAYRGEMDEVVVFRGALDGGQVRALAGLEAGSGVATVEVGLQHVRDAAAPGSTTWSAAALTPTGAASASWSYSLPDGLEGIYRLSLRLTDRLGNVAVQPNVWSGPVDTRAPRVRYEVGADRLVGFNVACRAEDFSLSLAPLCGDEPRDLDAGYLADAWYSGYFPQGAAPRRLAWLDNGGRRSLLPPARELKVCDTFGQCAAAQQGQSIGFQGAEALALAAPSAAGEALSAVLAPEDGTVITTSGAVPLTGVVSLPAPGLKELSVTVDGAPVLAQSYPSGTETVTWTASFAPPGDGVYAPQATATGWDGSVITDTFEPIFAVDTAAPAVSLDQQTLTAAMLLRATLTETVGLSFAEAQIDGGPWLPAELADLDAASGPIQVWLGDEQREQLERLDTATVGLRVTDVAGNTAETSRALEVDVAPPSIERFALAYQRGGAAVPLADGAVITDTADPQLSASWAAGDDDALASYAITWVTIEGNSFELLREEFPDAGASSDSLQLTSRRPLYVQLKAYDLAGNMSMAAIGPIYADPGPTPSPLAAAVFRADDPLNGGIAPYHGWLQNPCSLVGVDRRAVVVGADGEEEPQRLYVTWTEQGEAGLRLTWTGADWDVDGDLLVYLDSKSGGAFFNPHQGQEVALYGDFAPDVALWVRDSATAELLTYDGAEWRGAPARFTVSYGERGAITDLFVPFAALEIADPAAAGLKLLAVASEDEALVPWATMPSSNPLLSGRAHDGENVALPSLGFKGVFSWASLGAGICPNAEVTGRAALSAEVAASVPAVIRSWAVTPDLIPSAARDPELFGAELPALKDGDVVSYTVSYANRGEGPSGALRFRLGGDAGLRLEGGVELVVDRPALPAGASGAFSFSARADQAQFAQNAAGASPIWGQVQVEVYERDGQGDETLIDTVFVSQQHDFAPPRHVEVTAPLALLSPGLNSFQGVVSDDTGAASVGLEWRAAGGGGGAQRCADPTPGDRAWSCELDLGGLADGTAVEVRVRATDPAGQTGPWSRWLSYVVDAAPPQLALGEDSAAALADGVIGPDEVELSGVIADGRLPAAVLLCDQATGRCDEADVELDPTAALTQTVTLADWPQAPVALGGGALPACTSGALTRSFSVPEALTVRDVNLGLNVAGVGHGALRATLRAPDGTAAALLDGTATGDGNSWAVLLDDAARQRASDDVTDHEPLAAAADNPRAPGPDKLDVFAGREARGVWELGLCLTPGASVADGAAYLGATLYLEAQRTPENVAAVWRAALRLPAGSDGAPASFTLVGVDAAGNRGAPLRVDTALDETAPQLEVTGAALDAEGRILVAGRASDGGAVGAVRLIVRAPSGELLAEAEAEAVTAAAAGLSVTSWRFSSAPLAEAGAYELWVEAEDAAGNTRVLPAGAVTWAPAELRANQVFLPVVGNGGAPLTEAAQPQLFLPLVSRGR